LPDSYYYTAQQQSVCRQAEHQLVTAGDLYHGLKVVQPSAMKELAIEKPNVREIVVCDSYLTSNFLICLLVFKCNFAAGQIEHNCLHLFSRLF